MTEKVAVAEEDVVKAVADEERAVVDVERAVADEEDAVVVKDVGVVKAVEEEDVDEEMLPSMSWIPLPFRLCRWIIACESDDGGFGVLVDLICGWLRIQGSAVTSGPHLRWNGAAVLASRLVVW
jgi:hypothetical protein